MAIEVIMDWTTAELLGAIHPSSPNIHRAMLRESFFWRIRTRESLPYFWPNRLSPDELAAEWRGGIAHRSSE